VSITLVQSKTVLNPGSAAGSFSSPTTAGNCVVALIYTYSGSNVSISTSAVTLGGAAGNFAQAVAVQSGFASSDTQYIGAWVDPACAGGQTAIAATVSNATWINGAGLILLEFSGVATSSPVDQTSPTSATSGTSVTSGTTGATAVNNEMAVGAAYPDAGLASESGSFTNITMGTSPVIASAGYAAVASAGSTTAYTATGSSSGVWSALVFTLKPAAAFIASQPPAALQAVKRAATY
jgi:hypothetical protein